MIKYITYKIKKVTSTLIDDIYLELLKNKNTFVIIKNNHKDYVLTKEKSFFEVDDINVFIKQADNDVYYQTIIEENMKYLKKDLILYQEYLEQYKSKMMKIYAEKYLFGSVAVRTINNAFITTVRGKENWDEFTIVKAVDHEHHIIKVANKKATLNAPLLDNLFNNKKVKIIVHVNHEYDESLPYYEYYFPGTVRDSLRNNKTSFNIKDHGLILLFDKKGKVL